MHPLDARGFEEVRNIAAEAELDEWAALAHAAELRAYRRLHRLLKRQRALPSEIARELHNMPEVGDVAAWKTKVAAGRQEYELAEGGALDIVQQAERGE